MSESAPRISDEAVEFWAMRLYDAMGNNVFGGWEPMPEKYKDGFRERAREDLAAILHLLCGEPEPDRDRLLRGEEADARFATYDPNVDWPSKEHDRPADAIAAALDELRERRDADVDALQQRVNDERTAREKAEQELEQEARVGRGEGVRRHFIIGVACLVCVTLPFDIAGVHSGWVIAAGVIAGIAGMLVSAWVADRR